MNIEEKKRQAFMLYARGKSKSQIARLLVTDVKCISRWIEEQRAAVNHQVERINKQDYTGIAMERFQMIREEVWLGIEKSSRPGDRIKYLKAAMDLEIKEAAFLFELGALDGGAKDGEITEEVMGHLQRETNLAALDGLAAIMLSKRMGMEPQTLIDMQGSPKNVYTLAEPVGLAKKELALPEPPDATTPVTEKELERPEDPPKGE